MGVPRNRCLRKIRGIDPNVVFPAVMVQLASVGAQMGFQVAAVR
jgi:hypothetical protein